MLLYLLDTLFTLYGFMLLVRVLGSWIPVIAQSKVMQFIGFYTDPYLNLFRRIIPPLGMIDFSPIVAFIAFQIITNVILSLVK